MQKKFIFGLSILLAGCTTIPLTSIPKLSRINFLTTDIERVRIALTVPNSFGLRKPPAFFKYDYQLEGEELHQNSIQLEETHDPADLSGIPSDLLPGETLHVFRMPQSSAEQLAKLREDEKQRAKTQKRKGKLNVGIAGNFCKKSEPPDGPILTTTFVLTSETETWVTFTRNLDVRAQKGAGEELAKLEACK